jgi:hypothetical protein
MIHDNAQGLSQTPGGLTSQLTTKQILMRCRQQVLKVAFGRINSGDQSVEQGDAIVETRGRFHREARVSISHGGVMLPRSSP